MGQQWGRSCGDVTVKIFRQTYTARSYDNLVRLVAEDVTLTGVLKAEGGGGVKCTFAVVIDIVY